MTTIIVVKLFPENLNHFAGKTFSVAILLFGHLLISTLGFSKKTCIVGCGGVGQLGGQVQSFSSSIPMRLRLITGGAGGKSVGWCGSIDWSFYVMQLLQCWRL